MYCLAVRPCLQKVRLPPPRRDRPPPSRESPLQSPLLTFPKSLVPCMKGSGPQCLHVRRVPVPPAWDDEVHGIPAGLAPDPDKVPHQGECKPVRGKRPRAGTARQLLLTSPGSPIPDVAERTERTPASWSYFRSREACAAAATGPDRTRVADRIVRGRHGR